MRELNERQKKFCMEYLKDFNGSRAAVAAGYTKKNVRITAAKLLTNSNIQKQIALNIAKRSEKTKIDAEWVLTELSEMAFADIAEAYDENGKLKSIHDIPKHLRKMICDIDTIDVGEDSTVKRVKFCDRLKLIAQLGKHTDVQAWLEKHEHTGKMTLEQLVAGDDSE